MPFSRPTLADLVTRTAADVSARIRREELRWDDSQVYARVLAGAVDALYGYLDWLSRQIIYDTAEAEYLERWANIWGIFRKAPVAATGPVTFSGANGSIIPAGSVLATAAGVEYTTITTATLASGTATTAVTASIPAAAGNLTSGASLALVNPIAGVQSTAVAGDLVGGADPESDDDLRVRFLARIRNPPQGGSSADYVQWALEVAGVTRAWCYPAELGAGTVVVRFSRDNDLSPIPDAGEVTTVQNYIDARRPVTAAVTVVAPVAVTQHFQFNTPPGVSVSQKAVIQSAVASVLMGIAPGGTLKVEQINQELIAVSGQYAHFVVSPASDVAYSTGQMPVMGTVTWL